MSRYTQRKVHYRSKEEEQKGRFGFQYIRDHINYRTEIPEVPVKPKHRPDEKANERKLKELDDRYNDLKEKRREKKNEIKKLNQRFDVRISEIKKDVELGKKCMEVLHYDIDGISIDISKVSSSIRKKQDKLEDILKELRNHAKPQKRNEKNIEKMTVRELDDERARIEQKLTLGSLTKAEESGLNNLLIKIGRLRADTKREIVDDGPKQVSGDVVEKLNHDIQVLKSDIDRLKQERNKLFQAIHDNQWKIECIRDDISKFIADIKEIADQEHEETKELSEESKALKEKILEIREEIQTINKEFQERVNDYEYEQEKIKWIAWATKVQEEKREEWEAEKQQRKKQRLKEKEKETKGQKKEGDKKEEGKVENKDEKREERKKINRNQKQIDNCSFLIDYCKRLFPTNEERIKAQKKAIDLQEELKKGQWAKEKGVQIIQSKKQKEEEDAKPAKYQRRKQEPKEEEEAPSSKFNHDYFVQKLFDNAKIIPPTSVEQLDKIIKELEDKVEYYLLHPDEGVDRKFEQDKSYVDRTIKPTDSKYTKSKGGNKIINTEDFPSLS